MNFGGQNTNIRLIFGAKKEWQQKIFTPLLFQKDHSAAIIQPAFAFTGRNK
jgi:hypothetical protein